MKNNGGPYVLMAVLCQQAQQDDWGTLSLNNVLEELVIRSDGPRAPKEMPPFRLEADAVVSLAAGSERGDHIVSLVPIRPSGERLDPVSQEIRFDSEDSRFTAVFRLSVDIVEPGLHWFDVFLDDEPFTRIPIAVRYSRNILQLL